MSSIVKTEAVVLRTIKYSESSRIVTFYTRQFGKLSTIVKGARRPKNKFGSSLQPMSYNQIVVYKKEGRDLQTLAQSDSVRLFRRLHEDLERMSAGMAILEITNLVSHDEEENPALFRLLVESLSGLDRVDRNPLNILYRFELHLAGILGFQARFDHCVSCHSSDILGEVGESDIHFHIGKGGPLCARCVSMLGPKATVSREVFQQLRLINKANSPGEASDVQLEPASRESIEHLLWSFLRYHVPGFRPLKSEEVFSKILLPV